ncbi:hypothetical protein DYBT9275_05811 [Dyadobacter sp. CECT 9275]|uniref:Bacterial virulence domain-containing protein n=2 Tax=Dyadobacter helix TaxID=2822344 RepID=A0A916NNX5_9BACT|nr:hypothetical protein DYBT9275_05811 [Dyadobacter sp. CECT 9275]
MLLLLGPTLEVKAEKSDSLEYGMFGKIHVYPPLAAPTSFVIFLSGDGGWNDGVINMARLLTEQGALVAGIDLVHYSKALRNTNSACYYPAGDLEDLSLSLQKKYKFEHYLKPLLVGYSSGATWAYGAMAQSPAATFKGVIAMGFCPDVETDRSFCIGNGLKSHVLVEGKSYYLDRNLKLPAPFIVLNGVMDQVCNYRKTDSYMKNMPSASLVSLPAVGHGFSVVSRWAPAFIKAFKEIEKPVFDSDKKDNGQNEIHVLKTEIPVDLPLYPMVSSLPGDAMVFMLSGDGGWTSFDKGVAAALAAKGLPVLGMDTQQYYWKPKTPEKAAEDISKALDYYMRLWKRNEVILLGYSFGAGVAPFVASKLPPGLKEKLQSVWMLSPDEKTDFEVHLTDMLNLGRSAAPYDVIGEIKRIEKYKPICFFGSKEDQNRTAVFRSNGFNVMIIPGSHHFDDNYELIAQELMKGIPPHK